MYQACDILDKEKKKVLVRVGITLAFTKGYDQSNLIHLLNDILFLHGKKL